MLSIIFKRCSSFSHLHPSPSSPMQILPPPPPRPKKRRRKLHSHPPRPLYNRRGKAPPPPLPSSQPCNTSKQRVQKSPKEWYHTRFSFKIVIPRMAQTLFSTFVVESRPYPQRGIPLHFFTALLLLLFPITYFFKVPLPPSSSTPVSFPSFIQSRSKLECGSDDSGRG